MKRKLKQIINRNSEALEKTDKSFGAMFDIMFSQDAIAAEDNDGFKVREYTYASMKERILEASAALSERISCRHEYVALAMENSIDWVVAFWAILRSGNKPYLVNMRHPASLVSSALKRLGVRYVVGAENNVLEGEFIDISSLKTKNRTEADFENEIALSTSATSLKEVICFYRGENFSNQILNVKSFIGKYPEIANEYKGRIKNLAFLPFYHVFGLIAVYFWFSFFGQTIVFLKNLSPDTILKTCRKHEVTHVFAVPLLWHTIENAVMKKAAAKGEKTVKKLKRGMKICTFIQNVFPHFGMKLAQKIMSEVTSEVFGKSIRFCINGGSYIRSSALEMMNSVGYNLHNGYGMTEIGITSVELRTKPKHKNLNSIGAPFSSVEYRINSDGVLEVKGSSLCSLVLKEGAEQKMDGWFNTGDNVEQKDGVYYISGRAGDMIIGESGENINPDLIEQCFNLPEASNLSVIGLEEDGKSKVCMVLQIGKYLSDVKRNELLDKARLQNDALPTASRVQKFYVTTDAIMSATAVKTSRTHLKRAIENGSVSLSDFKKIEIGNENATYSPELMAEVKKIVADILGCEVSAIDDHSHVMVDLGADSMQYFLILSALADKFSVASSKNDTLRYTVHEFCEYIERHM